MNQHKKLLLLGTPEALSASVVREVLDGFAHEFRGKYLGAAAAVDVQWKPVRTPQSDLLAHCHQWADRAALVTARRDQCFPDEGYSDPEISKAPIFLSTRALQGGFTFQEITPYKASLLERWLVKNSDSEALSFEATITEPTGAQHEQLRNDAAAHADQKRESILQQNPLKYVVISTGMELIGVADTKEQAEEIARQHLERCTIYAPGGKYVGERWQGR